MSLYYYLRITKRDWNLNGGLANSKCFRRMRCGRWEYYYNYR